VRRYFRSGLYAVTVIKLMYMSWSSVVEIDSDNVTLTMVVTAVKTAAVTYISPDIWVTA
jgi:hypothetical protein